MKNIVAIIGESGAGKDTVFKILQIFYPQFNYIRRVTTRPQRENEPEDAYFFINNEKYCQLLLNNILVEVETFKEDWFYGTPRSQIIEETINIGIFSPLGVEQLIDTYGEDHVKVIYVTCPKRLRLLRSLEREYSDEVIDEIVRRFLADEKDFCELPFFIDIKVINDFTNKEDLINNIHLVAETIQKWKNNL